jgi:hypothetical protein
LILALSVSIVGDSSRFFLKIAPIRIDFFSILNFTYVDIPYKWSFLAKFLIVKNMVFEIFGFLWANLKVLESL